MGKTEEAMKPTYEMLKRAAKEVGLSLNLNKTEIMAPSCSDTHIGMEMKTGDTIDVVDEFV
jgi:hypothetical protein